MALNYGASFLTNDCKDISSIRNTGIDAATGEWIVTLDADSWMSPGVLGEIFERSTRSSVLGGGIRIKPERCRKFDYFGDWHFVRIFSNSFTVFKAMTGENREYLDTHWHEIER